MSEKNPSRRRFLAASGSAFGATWLAMSLPAVLSSCRSAWEDVGDGYEMTNLSADEGRELGAVVAQLIPTTDTPGAKEAGVINFLDAAFGTFFAAVAEPVRGALSAIAATVAEQEQANVNFSDLSDERQIEILKSLENEQWFGLLTFVTTVGMFSHPSYGGNKDKTGWGLMGFQDQHAWQPPFGYYDAEVQNAG